MTFAEDERQVYRKDLMKELPIAVEEDSQDERWGFTPAATQDLNKPVSMKPNPNNRVYPSYSHLQQPIMVSSPPPLYNNIVYGVPNYPQP